MNAFIHKIALFVSEFAGSSFVFVFSVVLVIGWLILGPFMHWSDTWQLIISSISSAVTFLMVFLIQYAQNKDTKALQVKLDELLRANKNARNDLVDIEQEPDDVLEKKENEIKEEVKSNTHSK